MAVETTGNLPLGTSGDTIITNLFPAAENEIKPGETDTKTDFWKLPSFWVIVLIIAVVAGWFYIKGKK